MCIVTEECAQKLLKLLVELLVTIHGFALVTAYMEEYKIRKETTTKGIKKELTHSETITTSTMTLHVGLGSICFVNSIRTLNNWIFIRGMDPFHFMQDG